MRDAMPSARPAAGIKLLIRLIPVCLIWGLSNILSSRIGGLRRACAELARAQFGLQWFSRRLITQQL